MIVNNDLYLTNNVSVNGDPLIRGINDYGDMRRIIEEAYKTNPHIFKVFELESGHGKAFEILNPTDPIAIQLHSSIEYASMAFKYLDPGLLDLISQFMGSQYGLMPTVSALLFIVLAARTSSLIGVKYPFVFKLWVSCPYILEKGIGTNETNNFIFRMNLFELNSRIDVLEDIYPTNEVRIPYLGMRQLLIDSGCLPLQNYLNNFNWSSDLDFRIFLGSLNPIYAKYVEWTALDFPELPLQLPQTSLNFLLEKIQFANSNILDPVVNPGWWLQLINSRLNETNWAEMPVGEFNQNSMWYYLAYILYARNILKLSSFIIAPIFMAPESIESILTVVYPEYQIVRPLMLPFVFSIQAIEAFRGLPENRLVPHVLEGTVYTGEFNPVHLNVIISLNHFLRQSETLPDFFDNSHYEDGDVDSVLDFLLHRESE